MTNTSGKVRVTKRENPYINIDKTSINDKGLSWGAKGLFAYILGLPLNWVIYISELSNHSTVGYTGTVSLLDELIKAGYIKRTALRNEKGHFSGYDYECFEQPLPIEQRTILKEKYKRPKTDKPKAENTEHGQTKYGETNHGETLPKDYLVQQVSKEVMNEGKNVVTDTPHLESEKESLVLSTSEIPNNCENEKTEKPINLSLKEKSAIKNQTRGAGGENSQSNVGKLDLDKDIAPLGMNNEKLDFIFLESSRIDTSEIRAKFTMWHERRARKTKGVRNCLHYQKIMRLVANSDLSESEVIEGLNMAYEKTWTGLEIEWIKNKTRQNKTQQNGTNNRLAQQKQYIADSPFFKGA